jgi:dTDP-4-dehydrorhamnose 3,5-epimerase
MPFRVTPTEIPDVLLIELAVFPDERGFFLETYRQPRYNEAGISEAFVQDNLRFPQAKLIYVVRGEIYDVAVDIRKGSPDFGKSVGVLLSEDNRRQLYIPQGFAHGFCVTGESADVIYKCTDIYRPDDECGLLWNDPALNISWPVKNPVVSSKDAAFPKLAEIPPDRLPSI